MSVKKRTPIRFGVLTALVWLVVAAGIIFILWQIINRISTRSIPISTATPNQTQINATIGAIVNSQLTASATFSAQTPTPSPTAPLSQTPTPPRPSPEMTPTPGAEIQTDTPTVLCDQAAAGNPIDITIPDNTVVPAGQSFIKTWKLVNSGSCPWTNSYSVYFFYGDQMSAPSTAALKNTVLPSESVEISVEMIAPQSPGTYQGNWMLANGNDELFGIGPNGNLPFWVRIIVAASQDTPTRTPTRNATANPTEFVTPTATPAGQLSGELQPKPGDGLDLDSLTLNNGDEDLFYQVDVNNYHWLTPVNETTIGVFGSLDPDQTECQNATKSQAPIAVESLAAGTYLCYTTSQANLGWALLSAVDPNDFTLTLNLLTWIQP